MNMIALNAAALRNRPVRSAETLADLRARTPLKTANAEPAPAPAPDGHEHPLATAHF